jgi:hypothetical protein
MTRTNITRAELGIGVAFRFGRGPAFSRDPQDEFQTNVNGRRFLNRYKKLCGSMPFPFAVFGVAQCFHPMILDRERQTAIRAHLGGAGTADEW